MNAGQAGPGRPVVGRERGLHGLLALVALVPWVVGPLMVADAERATFFGIEPPPCPSRLLLPAVGCPGCGLTRGIVLALHGEWGLSWSVHPGSLLVLALALGAAVVHGDILVRGRMFPLHVALLRWGGSALAAGLAGAWLLRTAIDR